MITHTSFLRQLLNGKQVELDQVIKDKARIHALDAQEEMLTRDISLIQNQLNQHNKLKNV